MPITHWLFSPLDGTAKPDWKVRESGLDGRVPNEPGRIEGGWTDEGRFIDGWTGFNGVRPAVQLVLAALRAEGKLPY